MASQALILSTLQSWGEPSTWASSRLPRPLPGQVSRAGGGHVTTIRPCISLPTQLLGIFRGHRRPTVNVALDTCVSLGNTLARVNFAIYTGDDLDSGSFFYFLPVSSGFRAAHVAECASSSFLVATACCAVHRNLAVVLACTCVSLSGFAGGPVGVVLSGPWATSTLHLRKHRGLLTGVPEPARPPITRLPWICPCTADAGCILVRLNEHFSECS